ncbi:MAG: type II toxin-antitoxin system MqsR family toxin [Sulfuricellaceae bacterium]
MEKRKPHYSLPDIQCGVANPANRVFTATALDGGLEMGLEESEMRAVIGKLTVRNLFKSMTATRDPAMWQDVYHAMTPVGIVAYIKITGYMDGRPPVIQFKRKDSAS